jgi:hypothetical protein
LGNPEAYGRTAIAAATLALVAPAEPRRKPPKEEPG